MKMNITGRAVHALSVYANASAITDEASLCEGGPAIWAARAACHRLRRAYRAHRADFEAVGLEHFHDTRHLADFVTARCRCHKAIGQFGLGSDRTPDSGNAVGFEPFTMAIGATIRAILKVILKLLSQDMRTPASKR